ncbi:MAG: hypothetical protein RLZZ341_849, partial [Pseudomonadota bacterium]
LYARLGVRVPAAAGLPGKPVAA